MAYSYTIQLHVLAIHFKQDMRNVKEFLMRNDFVSDGWTTIKDAGKPHPRCYGAFPRMIKKFVVDDKVI